MHGNTAVVVIEVVVAPVSPSFASEDSFQSLHRRDEGTAKLTQEAADMVMNAGGLVPYSDTAMSEDDFYIYMDYLALVYECEIDGQEFSEGLALDIR